MQPASTVTPNEALPARLSKGTELGDYVVDGWLRDGGMASIYRAHRASDAARVALKLQLRSTAHISTVCARFDREADAMRRVTGEPNVVELFRAGTLDDGRRYFVMEWIDGDNLEELLDSLRNDDQRLAVDDACEIGLQIAKGLAALHEHGLVHRDLKPANIMIDRAGDTLVVKLVDFGIVADVNAKPESHGDDPHSDEAVMGTSAYMAPEQAAGHAPMPAMDVFALGVVLYEALTGNPMPPDGWTPETLPTIDSLRRNVPPELVALVRRCMSDAELRPRSATEVASPLAVILQQMRTRGPRLVSSDEVPIRTGGTTLTPRSQVATVEDTAARTGGTEVVLTHEHVLSLSGSAHALPQRASAVVEVSSPARRSTSTSARDEQSPRPTRWWLVLVVMMPVVAGVSWWAGSRTGDEPSPSEQPPSIAVGPPESAPARELTKASPLPDPAPNPVPEQKDPVPEPTAPDEAPDGEDAPTVVVPETGTQSPAPSRPRGPDKATCERLRGEVTAAKTRRDWTSLLKATSQATCWPGALKLERRRLRVEAFAETGKYDRCVKEGGASSDSQIVARVKWCAKKLGT